MMRRIPGESTDVESWHRDEALNTQPGDDIFGGWINLDDQPQYFSCAPGTHLEAGAHDRNAGFAKITSAAEKEHYRKIAAAHGKVVIPHGHILIFYERLVHEVVKAKAERIMRRLFLGWRATTATEPLFGQQQTDAWIDAQSPPKIKSGQSPSIYPTAYYNFPRNFATLTDFCKSVFVPECLYSHIVKGGAYAGTTWTRVERTMKGLADYHLPMRPLYEPAERALLAPQRRLFLRTFDEPTQRVTFDAPTQRVQFKLVAMSDWETHLNAQHHHNSTPRPRPKRVSGLE